MAKTDTKTRYAPATGTSPTTSLALAAGAGVIAGLAANVVRKAIVQGPTALAGNWDEALAAEHKATIAILDALDQTTEANTTKRNILLMQLKHALGKHAFQEENVVYPALRDHGAIEGADALNTEHGYVKQYLYELDMLAKDSPAWIAKVREFRILLEGHMAEEEGKLFPKLRDQLGEAGNKAVTLAMNKEGLKLA